MYSMLMFKSLFLPNEYQYKLLLALTTGNLPSDTNLKLFYKSILFLNELKEIDKHNTSKHIGCVF